MMQIAIAAGDGWLASLLPSILPECSIAALGEQADITILDGAALPTETVIRDTIVLLNADRSPAGFSCINSTVITYGLNPHATVTYSSVAEDENGLRFCYCLQRGMQTLFGETVDGMEMPVTILGGHVGIYQGMCAVTCALLCGMAADVPGGILIRLPQCGLDKPLKKE